MPTGDDNDGGMVCLLDLMCISILYLLIVLYSVGRYTKEKYLSPREREI